MSQIVTRKGPVGEDKDKRQTDSPVKEMKKKIAANAEKEKQAAEKNAEKSVPSEKKTEKSAEKIADKPAEKKDKPEKTLDKSIEKKDKTEKTLDKSIEKKDKTEKSGDKKEKSDKTADKKESGSDKKENNPDKKDKPTEKKETPADKASDGKETNGKPDAAEQKPRRTEPKAKENGQQNGGDTVSSEDELQSDAEFPELAYDDSDADCFEPPTPERAPSRSLTRRDQNSLYPPGLARHWSRRRPTIMNNYSVKATRTPETPRPASEKNTDKDYLPDDSKLLKLKDDNLSTDRKLRSADSPKPQDKKAEKKSESPKKDASVKTGQDESSEHNEKDKSELEVEVEVVEIENENEDEEARRVKADTNYSKSRVKVSPYRRARPEPDLSLLANYTGNNTTMEMDITETSLVEAGPEPESPYLSGLRSIRARRSYRLRDPAPRTRPTVPEQPSRPTGTVVGRKRRPEAEAAAEAVAEVMGAEALRKRPRLLERLARPFRLAHSPPPARRAAEIVGINTDLPLTAPVASAETFDPEAIKPLAGPPGPPAPSTLTPNPPTSHTSPVERDRDGKRCVVM